ncbi:hypothetical protein MLD38_022579 [Melastoma candidum]|uniref:Uncharacterized protein n=1 Tax=Melastoma candidum TaxID=119954 RepID=A0ACB9QN34_9MYRT|nr:hypothetical protein MLD38_022579 [Melastoma candidum]
MGARHPLFSDEEGGRRAVHRLSKPLVGDDGTVYACSDKNLFAFEGNGTIAWSVHLNWTCNPLISPIYGGRGKLYVVVEDRILRIDFSAAGSTVEVFFGLEQGQGVENEILGVAVSTLSSSVYFTLKNRGLFAYLTNGELLWNAGPVRNQFGYRQGCRRSSKECYFTSAPVVDYCEAAVYISNTDGEVYSLSTRSPHFKWIRDFGSLDKSFVITAGNNGRLYVTVPAKALVLALDISTGDTLWQMSIGPLSMTDCTPVVDFNGWISISSLDGSLYSISPTGTLQKFPTTPTLDSVVQVNPITDCSGFGVYISQTQVEGKRIRILGDYTSISAMKPVSMSFTFLVPAMGLVYWSERYSDQLQFSGGENDLHHFMLDERILLAFVAASKTGNPLSCRSRKEKLVASCFQAGSKNLSLYTGDERMILLFLFFESIVLIVLALLVRFCYIFWSKKKLKSKNLGSFLQKRRMLQLEKRAVDWKISELTQKSDDEATEGHPPKEGMNDLLRRKERIHQKLSTTYSLERDKVGGHLGMSLLPLYGRNHSFQDAAKGSSDGETSWEEDEQDNAKGKAKFGEGEDHDSIDWSSWSSNGESDSDSGGAVQWASPMSESEAGSSATSSEEGRWMDSVKGTNGDTRTGGMPKWRTFSSRSH